MEVPSLEQKQYGNSHFEGSHFFAKSRGASVTGAGAVIRKMTQMKEKQIKE